MKITYWLLACAWGLYWQPLAAQLNGKILNEQNLPISNALISNHTNSSHTHSDALGAFTLEQAAPNDSISVAHPDFVGFSFINKNDVWVNIKLIIKALQLDEIVIQSNLNNLHSISNIDLETQPVTTSQELLRKVPGLFIGQHAGGGKAEQIFLRGFDIDHGTDISIAVDGMPVNMVSHAHGQGYADLHFLIPETVDKIDFDKGAYFADKGDLATAGYVHFKTKDRLEHSTVSTEIGQFNTFRSLALLNLLHRDEQAAYVAAEYLLTDNYFVAPQNFYRLNLFGKYTTRLSQQDNLAVSISHFRSQWDASGQIPDRAVTAGLISFYGAIDSTEGGNTGRSNLNIQHTRQISDHAFIKNTLYYSHYDFELFSNFTFFLEDSINGDQVRQRENRHILGIQSEYNERINDQFNYKLGLGFRSDFINDIELSHTLNRATVLNYLSLGDIQQNNLFAYFLGDYVIRKLLINVGLRADYFKNAYHNQLAPTYTNQSVACAIASPKLNFLYTFNNRINAFLKLGKGFHSNDTRVVVAQRGKSILPASYGADLGVGWKPLPRMLVNAAVWYLWLEQEFVYVGDAAVVEPSGKTQRMGVDIGVRYQLLDKLFWNADATYTYARALEAEQGQNFIPLAPIFTFSTGVSFQHWKGFSGSLRSRYLGDRPANEDFSVTAKGYFITDFSLSYQWRRISIGVNMDNIFNAKWKETQFLTESRLRNEASSVEEIHFTPGTPRSTRFIFKYIF